MQKLRLKQTTTTKLAPQQLQSIKLLQLSTGEMQARVIKEIEENPALAQQNETSDSDLPQEEEVLKDYRMGEDRAYFRFRKAHHTLSKQESYNKTASDQITWRDQLLDQLACLQLDKVSHLIGKHLIGSMEADGYLRLSLEVIVDEIAFTHYIDVDVPKVAQVLAKIQTFEPTGVGACSLQECLLLQLSKKTLTKTVLLARQILTSYFNEFAKKHHEKIATQLGISNLQLLRNAFDIIKKLNPRPIVVDDAQAAPLVLRPDFLVTSQQGRLKVSLYKDQSPSLCIHKNYADLLNHCKNNKTPQDKEATTFVRQKIVQAKWFMEAIQQRRQTLLRTMRTIVDLQRPFFEQGDETKLQPLFLRNVAEKIHMDVSTISRVVSHKVVQTDWGIYPLRYFFSEPINTTSGTKVSSRVIKKGLALLIKKENKLMPYSDELLSNKLKERGYIVSRRTVAKYRDQLNIPVARLRKTI